MNDLVEMRNNQIVTSSRSIAKAFGKRHGTVLRTIEFKKENLPTQKCADLFCQATYLDTQGKNRKEYLLNRDGFSFIVMGFTGAEADNWKLKYINAFNEMEKALIQKDSYMITDPVERAKAWIAEEEKRKALEDENTLNKPKVLFAEAVENSNDVILVKEMALLITQNGFKIGQNQLFQYLRDYEFLCKKKGDMYHLPTKKYEHFFKVTKNIIGNSSRTKVTNTPKITGKGQMYFIKKFEEYKNDGYTVKDLLKGEQQ